MAGVHINVKVQPKAGRNEVILENEGSLRVYVTAAPEGGKANKAVISLLAKRLRVAKTSIRILRGHKSRHKVLLLEDLGIGDVNDRLGLQRTPQDGENDEVQQDKSNHGREIKHAS